MEAQRAGWLRELIVSLNWSTGEGRVCLCASPSPVHQKQQQHHHLETPPLGLFRNQWWCLPLTSVCRPTRAAHNTWPGAPSQVAIVMAGQLASGALAAGINEHRLETNSRDGCQLPSKQTGPSALGFWLRLTWISALANAAAQTDSCNCAATVQDYQLVVALRDES